MSISRIHATRVSCDHLGADERGCPSQVLAEGTEMSEAAARTAAAERGWSATTAGDRCPRHREGGGS